MRSLLLAAALLLSVADALATTDEHEDGGRVVVQRNLRFEHIGIEDGLSQATVMSMAQDSKGFIWIGTQEGLNLYDGHNIRVFTSDATDPSSLNNEMINDLFVNMAGELWVATDGGGINIYDHASETFSHILHDPASDRSISSNRVRTIYQDASGTYWIGTVGAGLNRLDPGSGDVERFRADPDDPRALPNDTVLAITEDRRGRLWIGTDGGGLARLDRSTMSFVSYQHDGTEHGLSDNRVGAIYEDRDGWLWIGTNEGGLNRLDSATGKFEQFVHDPNDANSLINNRIRDLLQDQDGTLWVATEDGLDEWRPRDQGFAHYQSREIDSGSLSESRLTVLLQGSEGVLWVGSYDGVNKWNYFSDAFTHYQAKDGFLNEDIVTAIAESSSGVIWAGTYGGGLSAIDLKAGTSRSYRHQPQDETSLSDDRVMAVHIDAADVVWAGSRAGGLNRLDRQTGQFRRYGVPVLSSNSITALFGDHDGTLWIGTFGGGLNRMDPKGEVSHYRHDPADPSSIGSDRVLAIHRDSQGELWIGTEDGGLNQFNAARSAFTRFVHDEDDPDSISSNAAWELLETSDGSLWVATMGDGLNRWRPGERQRGRARFEKWTKSRGLRSNTAFGLLEDDAGGLWLSSNRGIARLDPSVGDVRYYDRRNGLLGDDFHLGARAMSRSGQMLFGGTKGVVSFYPGQIRRNQSKPPIVLSAHSPLERLVVTYGGATDDPIAVLGQDDNYVAFEFAALDYISPDKNAYRYMLEGFDAQWLDPGNMRRVVYANLPAGDYLFRVKASNSDGAWNEEGAQLSLSIEPSPWSTQWAYGAYAMVICLVIFAMFRYQQTRFAMVAEQRRELEIKVAQRTSELGQRNRQLEDLNTELRNASLTDSLTRLYNRRYLHQFIHSHLASVERETREKRQAQGADFSRYQQSVLFFMMIDLDGFKLINDTHGHNAGDRALVQVRDRLVECSRKSDTIFRWGGDEFLVVGRTLGISGITNCAERVRMAVMERSYDVGGGHSAELTCSIGAVPYPFAPLRPELLDLEQTLSVADYAAYLVKTNGRNGWITLYGNSTIEAFDTQNIPTSAEQLLADGKLSFATSVAHELVFDSGKQHVA